MGLQSAISAAMARPGQNNMAKIKSLTALFFEHQKSIDPKDSGRIMMCIEQLATEALMETECSGCGQLVY